MWRLRFAGPAALILAVTLPTFTLAEGRVNDEIEHLKRENAEMKRMQMQEQLQGVMMKTNAMEQQAKKTGSDSNEGMVNSEKEVITIATTGGGIKVKSSRGNEFTIAGRLMFDHDSYDDFWGSDAEENEIRRSRITLSGKSGKNWSYKLTTNIDNESDSDLVDTGYFRYTNKPMYFQVGKFTRPAMLEERTSSKWSSTIELSIVHELSGAVVSKPSFGGVEVGYESKGDMPMSGAIGLYDNEIEEDDGGDVYGIGARFSIMPKLGEGSFLHAGASFYTVDYKGEEYRLRSRMGVHTTGRPFETDKYESDDVDQMGVELAYVSGPFSLQGEFMNVDSDGRNNSACAGEVESFKTDPSGNFLVGDGNFSDLQVDEDSKENTCDLEMDGFYLQAAYTLTGETRGYKSGSGAFAAIKPKGEMGAWEVVARYEDAEVDIPGRGLSAGLERMVLGVNWYVNNNVKFMVNYVDAESDSCSGAAREYAESILLPGGVNIPASGRHVHGFKTCKNDGGDAISLRGQYVF